MTFSKLILMVGPLLDTSQTVDWLWVTDTLYRVLTLVGAMMRSKIIMSLSPFCFMSRHVTELCFCLTFLPFLLSIKCSNWHLSLNHRAAINCHLKIFHSLRRDKPQAGTLRQTRIDCEALLLPAAPGTRHQQHCTWEKVKHVETHFLTSSWFF